MKTKIITKIAKWSYVGIIIITAPLWLILGGLNEDASTKGLKEGLKVIEQICTK